MMIDLLVTAIVLAAPPTATPAIGTGAGIGPDPFREPCISEAMRERVRRRVADYYAAHPERILPLAGGAAHDPIVLYPMGGSFYQDIFVNNFVDLDDTAGLLDWDCTDRTYDGHKGSDTDIRSFAEQALGVPVYAALPGIVIETNDGEFDENVAFTTDCSNHANYVVIDHGNGRIGKYWHFRSGSVMVAVDDVVVAGQQIGEVGSSGCSTGPHLHFELEDDGTIVEPYAGPCGPSASQWADQDGQNAIDWTPSCWDFGIGADLVDGIPYEFPRVKQLDRNQVGFIWILMNELPVGATGRYVVTRPDDSIQTDQVVNWGNTSHWRLWWWNWTIIPNVVGTWRADVYVDDVLVVSAPFDVKEAADAETNRAPAELLGVQIESSSPKRGEPIRAVVQAPSRYLDDPDYDLLTYQYVWRVNGTIVRNVTTAALADTLPTAGAASGATITCTVRATDGTAFTGAHEDSVTLRPANDDCMAPTELGGLNHGFSTLGATTDGPGHPQCAAADGNMIQGDIWFRFFAPVDGTMTASTCGSAGFDTKLAIYEAYDCVDGLSGTFRGCNDDGPDCTDGGSELTVPVTAGQSYLVRIGGVDGATGTGVLHLSFDEACPADVDGSGGVDFNDLLQLLANWGVCSGACPEDLDDDGAVTFTDVILVLSAWGPC